MKTRAALVMTLLAVVTAVASPGEAVDAVVVDRSGTSLQWTVWLDEHAPVAVICWASWAPGSADVLKELDALEAAAEARGLDLVLVSVQEDLGAAHRALSDISVDWLHDRYGGVLKHHRVVKIPALVIVGADGETAARLEPTAEALRAWPGK